VAKKKKKIIRSETPANSASSADGRTLEKVKSRGKSTRVKPARTQAQKNVASKAKPSKSTMQPSEEQIRMRAYFISERRRRFDLPGDANADWLEAKRQLLSEVGHR
jgi:Protein of unknown function (DUF2934)